MIRDAIEAFQQQKHIFMIFQSTSFLGGVCVRVFITFMNHFCGLQFREFNEDISKTNFHFF